MMRPTVKKAAVTLDLEADHAGLIPEAYSLWTGRNVDELLTFTGERGVPLSVFVVANTLTKFRPMITAFGNAGAIFHLHSFSHRKDADHAGEEISHGVRAFRAYFGRKPVGYRAPECRISREALRELKRAGVAFDASELPSFWPELTNLRLPVRGVYQPLPGLTEIPFTVVPPFRIPFSLSFIKLIGWNAYSFLLRNATLPRVVTFNLHLHDLWTAEGAGELPRFWRTVYHRHADRGFEYLGRAIYHLRERGYTFTHIDDLLPGNTHQ